MPNLDIGTIGSDDEVSAGSVSLSFSDTEAAPVSKKAMKKNKRKADTKLDFSELGKSAKHSTNSWSFSGYIDSTRENASERERINMRLKEMNADDAKKENGAAATSAAAAAPKVHDKVKKVGGDDDGDDDDDSDNNDNKKRAGRSKDSADDDKNDDGDDDEDDNEARRKKAKKEQKFQQDTLRSIESKRKAKEAKLRAFFSSMPQVSATPFTSFRELNLSRQLIRAVDELGYSVPTPIQCQTIPLALAGKDVCGSAVTGSGKTAAFLLPVLERLLHRRERNVKIAALVLLPTRELAIQCHSMCENLAKFADVRAVCVVGGMSVHAQEAMLRIVPDIVIGTPGRVLDHIINSKNFGIEDLDILILDEADRLLEMGFEREITEILKMCPKKSTRQTLLFSATMTEEVEKLSKLSLREPVLVRISQNISTASTLTEEFIRVRKPKMSQEEIDAAIRKITDETEQIELQEKLKRKQERAMKQATAKLQSKKHADDEDDDGYDEDDDEEDDEDDDEEDDYDEDDDDDEDDYGDDDDDEDDDDDDDDDDEYDDDSASGSAEGQYRKKQKRNDGSAEGKKKQHGKGNRKRGEDGDDENDPDSDYVFKPSPLMLEKSALLLSLLTRLPQKQNGQQEDGSGKQKKGKGNNGSASAGAGAAGERPPQVVVFFRTKAETHKLRVIAETIGGLAVGELQGNMNQNMRLRALESFRTGVLQYLFCTDVASRGLDIPGVDLVVNFEMPRDERTYVHRVGRTARAGRGGRAVTLFTEEERLFMKRALVHSRNAKMRLIPDEVADFWRSKIVAGVGEITTALSADAAVASLERTQMSLTREHNLAQHKREIMERPRREWIGTEEAGKTKQQQEKAERKAERKAMRSKSNLPSKKVDSKNLTRRQRREIKFSDPNYVPKPKPKPVLPRKSPSKSPGKGGKGGKGGGKFGGGKFGGGGGGGDDRKRKRSASAGSSRGGFGDKKGKFGGGKKGGGSGGGKKGGGGGGGKGKRGR